MQKEMYVVWNYKVLLEKKMQFLQYRGGRGHSNRTAW